MTKCLLPQRTQAMEIHAVSCHSLVCGCWKGTQSTEVNNKEKEIRASSNVTELRQNSIFLLKKRLVFRTPQNMKKCHVTSENTGKMQNTCKITCILCLPRCQKYCKILKVDDFMKSQTVSLPQRETFDLLVF